MRDKDTRDSSLRLMTSGEIMMAKNIFRDTIIYPKVWIHKVSYLPFGLQSMGTSMSPNGEMYFRNDYSPDVSKDNIRKQQIFIHELSHVWQYQHGMNVKIRGLISWAVNYHYVLNSWPLSTYRMEQQAQIIADYYILAQPNSRADWEWYSLCTNCKELSDDDLLRQYQYTLSSFPWSL